MIHSRNLSTHSMLSAYVIVSSYRLSDWVLFIFINIIFICHQCYLGLTSATRWITYFSPHCSHGLFPLRHCSYSTCILFSNTKVHTCISWHSPISRCIFFSFFGTALFATSLFHYGTTLTILTVRQESDGNLTSGLLVVPVAIKTTLVQSTYGEVLSTL